MIASKTSANSKHPSQKKRIEISLPVKITLLDQDSTQIEGEIRNISESGAYIHAPVALKVGQKIELTINFEKVHCLRVAVTDHSTETEPSIVKWIRKDGGFGIQFEQTNPKNAMLIRSLIRYFEMLKRAGVSF